VARILVLCALIITYIPLKLDPRRGSRTPQIWVTKNVLSSASESILSRFSRQHLQLVPINLHWARVVGYDPFSLYVIHKEDLCASSVELIMMMTYIILLLSNNKGKEKSPSDEHCQCKKEMDDHWHVNKFLKESHIVTRLAKERESFLKINDNSFFGMPDCLHCCSIA
jgi:hypothetical protein